MVLKSYTKLVKHEQVSEYIKSIIKTAEHGEILPSQTALASDFNVNHLTVRRAFQNLEKEGLIYRIRGKGTFVRKTSNSDEKLTFLVMLYHDFDLYPYAFRARVLLSMMSQSSEMGFSLHVCGLPEKIKDIGHIDFDGVIGLNPARKFYDMYYDLKEKGHTVFLANRIEENFNYVSIDHAQGARDMVKYFVAKGHKRISFIGNNNQIYVQLRYAGFTDAMEENGLKINENSIIYIDTERKDQNKSFQKDFNKVLKSYKPTAVIVSGHSFMPPVLSVLRKNKISLSRDIEVATYDDIDPAVEEKEYIHEISTPIREMGQSIIKEISLVVAGQKKKSQVIIKPEIIIKKF